MQDEKHTQSQSEDERLMGRRTLLKTIAVAGGFTAASMLPSKWVTPAIGQGALPPNGQLSQQDNIVIAECSVEETDGGWIPSVTITPAMAGISMTLTVVIGGTGTGSVTVATNASGIADAGYINPFLPPYNWNGVASLEFRWNFANPADGTATCSKQIPPFQQPE